MDIRVNTQSSIRIEAEKTIYFDPFKIKNGMHDSDIIFITHPHYDHMSEDAIAEVSNENTVIVLPFGCENDAMEKGLNIEKCIFLNPGETKNIEGLNVKAVPSYNIGKKFHKMSYKWLGYVVTIDKKDVYVCGDMDDNPYAREVNCDICFVPVGGTYTMDYKEAADFINEIKPKTVIPTHYGSIVGEKEDGKRFKSLIEEGINVNLILED